MEIVENKTILEEQSSKRLCLIIGLAVGLGLLSILVILILLALRRRRAKPLKASVPNANLTYGKVNLKLKMSFAEIQAATQSFDTKLLIGEGGFGKVYKGTLGDGTKVAVKRSDLNNGQGLPEFQTEVLVLSKIRHRHLVSLIGYCDEGDEMILVYEFMDKGTLRDHLYAWKESPETSSALSELTWKQRLEICIGAAKGLHYLHSGSDGGIIHRDVKSTNILLDEHYVAKVADFGLSQLGPSDPDHFSTGLKGSFGYLDPQYFRTLQLTNKSDVYSFGVVLCEVLCARKPIVKSSQREEINLAEWVLVWQAKGQLEKIIDPSLAGNINPNSLRKFGEIAEKCLKPEGADRPSMIDICWYLEYALQLQQTATHREPHEDSRTDAYSALVMPLSERANADDFPIEEQSLLFRGADDSYINPSGVFSQMNIDGAR
uniref:Pto-like kinase OGw family protein n=1 Tax=Rhizophora mucronata TaxID=61149 RepID=A0A2P2MWG3_RHIMU